MVFYIGLRKCPRVIHPSKYERQSSETFNWWLRLFQLIETDFAIPPYKRKQVVREIFPYKIFEKIVSLITLIDNGDLSEQTQPQSSATIRPGKDETDSKLPVKGDLLKTTSAQTLPTTTASDVTLKRNSELDEKEKGQDFTQKPEVSRKDAGPNNPYLRFFKRNPERAAIWHDLSPLSLEEMNLNQKAEAITEAIATDFVNWIKNLGGETQTTLDVPQVVKMFEIGFNTHAATSLEARVKEMPAVTKSIAQSRSFPKKAVRSVLHRKIQEDKKAFSKKKRVRAFGRTLPSEMRYVPPKTNPTDKWLQIEADENLKTMSAVWDGITDLRSTRAFCKWLTDHPELPAPTYLRDLGMLTPTFFDQPHYSIDTQESADQSLTAGHNGASAILQKRLN